MIAAFTLVCLQLDGAVSRPDLRLVVPTGHGLPVEFVAADAQAGRVLTGGGQQAVLWTASGHQLASFGGLEAVRAVDLDSVGRYGAVCGAPEAGGVAAQVIDVGTGAVVAVLPHQLTITDCAFVAPESGSSWLLAWVDGSRRLTIASPEGRQLVYGPPEAEYRWIEKHPDGLLAVSENEVQLWSVTEKRILRRASIGFVPQGAKVSSSGEVAVFGGSGLKLFDRVLETSRVVSSKPVRQALFAPGLTWTEGAKSFALDVSTGDVRHLDRRLGTYFAWGKELGILTAGGEVDRGGQGFSVHSKIRPTRAISYNRSTRSLWNLASDDDSSKGSGLIEWSLDRNKVVTYEVTGGGTQWFEFTKGGIFRVTSDKVAWLDQLRLDADVRGGASDGDTKLLYWTDRDCVLVSTDRPESRKRYARSGVIAGSVGQDGFATLSRAGELEYTGFAEASKVLRWRVLGARAVAIDGHVVYAVGAFQAVRRFRLDLGTELAPLSMNTDSARVMTIEKGGRLTVGDWRGDITTVDPATGQVSKFSTRLGRVRDLEVDPEYRWIASLHDDGVTRFWTTKGDALAWTCALPANRWVAADSIGRYDSNTSGSVEEIYWLVGETALELQQLRDSFFDPGVLPKRLGYTKDPVRVVPDLADLSLPPQVRVVTTGRKVDIHVTAIDDSIGRVEVLWDGAVVETRENLGREARFQVDLDRPPYWGRSGAESSTLKVRAYASNSALRSRAGSASIAASTASVPRKFFALCVGTNYSGQGALKLNYAEADARSMAQALSLLAASVYKDQNTIRVLTGPEVSRSRITSELEAIRTLAGPDDIVFLYFSGHGIIESWGGRSYRYLTSSASQAPTNAAEAERSSISEGEIRSFFTGEKSIKARNKLVVLDTCAAGGFADPRRKSVDTEVQRALADLQDRGGMTVLSGCAADRSSYEDHRVGHGLLTYALLEILDQWKPEPDLLTSNAWFADSEQRVGQLIDELDAQLNQRPRMHGDADRVSVPLGLRSAVHAKLGLLTIKPVVEIGNVVFEQSQFFADELGLKKHLETAMSGAKGGPVRLSRGGSTGGIMLHVRYRLEESDLVVQAQMLLTPETFTPIQVRAPKADLGVVAAKIVEQVGLRIEERWQPKTKRQ